MGLVALGLFKLGKKLLLKKLLKLMLVVATSIYFLIFGTSDGTVLISDHSMSRLIELTTKHPFCHLHNDRGTIRNLVFSSDPRKVRQMSDDSISKLEEVCRNHEVQSAHQGGFIYPGTKWCGPGTVAKNYSDLGFHEKEDMCCREHDNCKNYLSAGECRQGICNKSPYTRSHCDCDAKFRRCLQNVNTETANTIGAIFFNIVQVICFKERSPCSQWQNSIDSNEVFSYVEIDEVREGNITYKRETPDCPIVFKNSGRFVGSRISIFEWKDEPETFLNMFLRKLRILRVGYTKPESDKLCSQWKYRPSEKYIPLMPISNH